MPTERTREELERRASALGHQDVSNLTDEELQELVDEEYQEVKKNPQSQG